MRFPILSLALAAFTLAPLSAARAEHTGVQVVGLNKVSESDRDLLAVALRQADQSVEVSFLPYEFTFKPLFPALADGQTEPQRIAAASTEAFGPASRLIEHYFTTTDPDAAAHPPKKLVMTVCLHFYHSITKYPGTRFRWDAFDPANDKKDKKEAKKPGKEDAEKNKAFREDYLRRVAAAALWIKTETAWAEANHVGDKLAFIVIPSLEDDCDSAEDYNEVLAATHNALKDGGAEHAGLRRSALPDHSFRAKIGAKGKAVPLEMHGAFIAKDKQASTFLIKGDTYSNDGSGFDLTSKDHRKTFIDDQAKPALKKDVSVLYWACEFNVAVGHCKDGDSEIKAHPSTRQPLTPFGGDKKSTLYTGLIDFLNTKP